MTRYHLNANVVLRFLRNDDAQQSPAAARLIESAKTGDAALALSTVTVAEVFYALRTSYKITRRESARLLSKLLRSSVFEVEQASRVLDALQRIEKSNVDFGDAYLAATAAETGEALASFDEDFKRFSDVQVHRP
ncbi:MAG TPA: PIN domain-containing protein [Opitutaceae bacterium]